MNSQNINIQNTVGETTATPSGITPEERATARFCIDFALKHGASAARVSLGKNTLDSIMLLNGSVDKVSRCADRSVYINLFVDGKYGGYSTNRLDRASLESFILEAVENTRILAEDECRCLPSPEVCVKDARTGDELGLTDSAYEGLSPTDRLRLAAEGTRFTPGAELPDELKNKGFKIISEECEWSDSTDDNYVADSQGLEGRHRETSFNFWTEITIEDRKGQKYTGYHWESSPFLRDVDIARCSPAALKRAAAMLGQKRLKSGKYTMVVENTSASRLISPLFSALSAMAIQQNNSFLADSLGRKLFPEELTVTDFAHTPGKCGSRLFDSEGVATKERDIISKGEIRMYFVNTYMSKKMNLAPTVEGVSRPTVLPFIKGEDLLLQGLKIEEEPTKGEGLYEQGLKIGENLSCRLRGDKTGSFDFEIGLKEIMEHCGEGILVTGFNGGNCNPTTGNFSYGVEGFVFKGGKILHPFKEALVTGNMISLWNSIVAAGTDPRSGTRWQIPTLAFTGVDFSA